MTGMSRTAGTAIDGLDSIRESVRDILGTPIGARTCREDYGSLVPDLIDRPMTSPNIMRIFAATAVALSRWEDRIRLRRVSLATGDHPGAATLILDADRTDTSAANARTRLAIPL
jgi:phage baseplate assembly protein W